MLNPDPKPLLLDPHNIRQMAKMTEMPDVDGEPHSQCTRGQREAMLASPSNTIIIYVNVNVRMSKKGPRETQRLAQVGG